MKLIIFLFLLNFNLLAQKRTFLLKSVHDGDTIEGSVSGINLKIRIAKIDAPEVLNKYTRSFSQEYGETARDSVKNYLKGKKLTIKILNKDKYGRTVAELFVQRKDVSLVFISKGWAWAYTDFIKDSLMVKKLNILQEKAKNNKLGLWAYSNPIYPKTFRNDNIITK